MIIYKRTVIVLIGLIIFCFLSVYLYLTRPVKIGVIISTQTSLGYEQNNAIRFYRDRFTRIGFRPVKYYIYNPALNQEEISNAYRQLEKQGVSAIIGGAISAEGMALAKEAKRTGIPTLAFTVSSDQLSNQKDSFYKFYLSTKYVGKYAAKYLQQPNVKKLAIFTDIPNKSYSEPFAKSIKDNFKGDVLLIPWDSSPGIWKRYRNFNPDYSVMILPAHSMIEVIRRSKAIYKDMPFIIAQWDYEKLHSNYYSPLIEGLKAFTVNPGKSLKYKELISEYEKKYQLHAHFGSEYVFSTLDILYKVIKNVGSSSKSINSYLSKPRVYDFAYGKVFLNEYGDVFPQKIYVKQIEGNKIEIRKEISVNEFSASK